MGTIINRKELKNRLLPFLLTGFVLLADQLSKFIVVKTIPLTFPPKIGWSLFGDFLHFIHVRNPAIAFSIGYNWSPVLRFWIFSILTSAFLLCLIFWLLVGKDLKPHQRWLVAGIIGGGLGNLTDRFLRPEGVVDFISVKFYGLLGMERWPTFNLADSAVVVCMIPFFISVFFFSKKKECC